jgi:hypothetical protein
MKMNFVLMAFAAAGIISGSTLALAETPVAPAEEEKIKATIEGRSDASGAYRQDGQPVLGTDLNCSESRRRRYVESA